MKDDRKGNVLIVDDEFNAVRVLSAILSQEGYKVAEFQQAEEALRSVPKLNPDLIISDLKMPYMDGMEFFKNIKTTFPNIPFIFLSAFGTIESAVDAMASGAYHFFVKPPDYIRLKEVVAQAIEGRPDEDFSSRFGQITRSDGHQTVFGQSPSILNVLQTAEEVKDSAINVLITGETGTGKELIARLLHYQSHRKNRPFVTVNCAAIPRELMEAELFGSEKGSYTGSTSRRVGKFEEAAGGTILLDEIGELPLPLQAKLLRVLQEREIERIGNNKKIKVDFRLLSSTNRDLKSNVQNGTFREDLYYRINVIHLELPSLSERVEDIPILANEFVREFAAREKKNVVLSDEAIQMLQSYHWPGNVRQLKNAIERAVVLAKGRRIIKKDFAAEFQAASKKQYCRKQSLVPLRELELDAVRNSLTLCNGNKSKAARLLGISRKALYRRLSSL